MSLLFNFLFPPPPSIFITAMSVISFASLANAGYSEFKGKHLQYSKFWNTSSQKAVEKKKEIKISSRNGMLILYVPAFLAGVLALGIYPNDGFRFMLVDFALTLHFFKRVFEVLFVHKYSGGMVLDSVIPISLSYTISTATMIYNQHLTHTLPEPSLDFKYAGVALFLLSTIGNFYHHTILAKLREKDDKGYKIPKGGLFNILICPHYLFEILAFVGICFISQTIYPICFTAGTAIYLTGRSYATRRWYLSKFPDFPKDVKALIPFVF
ncbi:hypothetical protein ACHQM5_013088 [Ranunculus cassubicifolius]